jgi:uncharacterized membrane-anchored protein
MKPRFPDHPDRLSAQLETHARPIVPVSAPARIRRIAFLFADGAKGAPRAQQRFLAWCGEVGVVPSSPDALRVGYETAGLNIVWELHTEFMTFTWVAGPTHRDPWPEGVGLETAGDAKVVVSTRIDVLEESTLSERTLAGFDPLSLCHSKIEGGRCELATDFVTDEDGFTRFEFASGGLDAVPCGTIIRRILEIETYRTLSLIGLPVTRQAAGTIARLEARLGEAVAAMANADSSDSSHGALEKLHAIQLAVSQVVEATRYRFATTKAYGRILWRRLESLDEQRIGDNRTLLRYLRHRLEPAMSTSEAVEKREAELLAQLSRSTELLNTRIGFEIQRQNQTILSQISNTADSQFRLQRTVEGLSTIAISYYALGILGYVLHVFDKSYEFEKSLFVALAAPLIVAFVWFAMRRIRKRHRS